MFPKTGNNFPNISGNANADEFAITIGQALKGELGTSRKAAKSIMKWTGASERSAKNWLAGTHGPSGWHLILLARQSDSVMAVILMMAGRELNISALALSALRSDLMEAVEAIDEAIKSSS
ncbi:MAG: hypothetical protein HQ482_02035 [Sphingomonadales bacterium]|nr:hypothetical protein [Sphingomonadales bacterium]